MGRYPPGTSIVDGLWGGFIFALRVAGARFNSQSALVVRWLLPLVPAVPVALCAGLAVNLAGALRDNRQRRHAAVTSANHSINSPGSRLSTRSGLLNGMLRVVSLPR